jgi:hypothetical protein
MRAVVYHEVQPETGGWAEVVGLVQTTLHQPYAGEKRVFRGPAAPVAPARQDFAIALTYNTTTKSYDHAFGILGKVLIIPG